MSIESQQLKDMGISFAMGDTEKLLPFTMLCVEEFEIIHAAEIYLIRSIGQCIIRLG